MQLYIYSYFILQRFHNHISNDVITIVSAAVLIPPGASVMTLISHIPDSKVYGANMGPIWGRQDPGGPHVGPMKLAFWDIGPPLEVLVSGLLSYTTYWYV